MSAEEGQDMEEKCLVIGGNGLLGYGIVRELAKRGKMVRCADIVEPHALRIPRVEYCVGDIRNKHMLDKAMQDIDVVFDFSATTLPNTNDVSLNNEINSTLQYYDSVLSCMVNHGVIRYCFPSSGGAIYGNVEDGVAREEDHLMPTTPYGAGKKMVEDMIEYYHNKCGISSCIFRIGNPYGSSQYRKKPQGIIDVLIQSFLKGEPVTIWGEAEKSIRDYIFLDDVVEAIVGTMLVKKQGLHIYNLGTGRGTSVGDLIRIISDITHIKPLIQYDFKQAFGVNRIVLSYDRLYKDMGWKPRVSLEEGIKRTIEIKRNLLKDA